MWMMMMMIRNPCIFKMILLARNPRISRSMTSNAAAAFLNWSKCHDIDKQELKSLIDQKHNFCLVDVREPDEFSRGSIPTAFNIPLSAFEQVLSMTEKEIHTAFGVPLRKNDNIVVYCQSGKRSSMASLMLQAKGYSRYAFHALPLFSYHSL